MNDLTNQYIVAQEEHDYNKKYEKGTIVKHTINDVSTAYTAKQNVPQFISILNENYWKKIASIDECGTVDYDNIKNKPTINGVELDGNKTSQDLGVYSKPSNGIPQSDLSSDIQSQLNKHFKGWYASSSALPDSPVVGDYAYVKGAETTDPAAIYECTTAGSWSDSGRTADTSNVQTFASGEKVNETYIDDTHLVNPADGALPTAADVLQLKAKLKGVTAMETKSSYVAVSEYKVKGDGALSSNSSAKYTTIPLNGAKSVRFIGVNLASSSSEATKNTGYCFGHYNGEEIEANWVIDSAQAYEATGDISIIKEYVVIPPTSSTHLRTNVKYSAVNESDFYCYLQSGESVIEHLVESVDYPQTWTILNGYFHFTLNEEPSVTEDTTYRRVWVQNLQVGDVITVRARVGNSKQTGAKTKNGVVVSILDDNPTGSGVVEDNVPIRTYVVDDTFDGICFNNYNGFVHYLYYFCKLTRNENSIPLMKEDIEDLQETVNTIIEQGVGKEINVLCFGNSFTEDTISYVPFLLREAEPNYKFNFYFVYSGGAPISQYRSFVGGNGTESIVYDGNGNITGKYVNKGSYEIIYAYSGGEWVVSDQNKPYVFYKLPWDANAWTSQSAPTIETVLNAIGEGKKWDLITIQQGGSYNFKTWDWYFKPYVYGIYATLKNRLNYNFKIGYLMTHGAYSTSAEELLNRYNGVVANATKIMENTPTEVLLPYATALQNARTTYLTRFGSYVMDGAKIKNGFVVETFKKGSTDINITCDGTFDAIILNNNNDTVANPSCTKNGVVQTWNDGVFYGGLYQYAQPIERTSSTTYKSIYLTGLVEGDVIVSNNNTDDAGVCLLTDMGHVADGIGCLTCSYANTLAILDMIGSSKSIVGSQIVPNAEWINEHNIPGASRVYGLTRYNIWLAQQCAVIAAKYPLQLTDMVARGMCGDTEIEIVNDAVYSSNPILSANNGDSWETALVAPDGMAISSVSVVMGSTDITTDVYTASTNTVNIPNVSAKVTITVTTMPS